MRAREIKELEHTCTFVHSTLIKAIRPFRLMMKSTKEIHVPWSPLKKKKKKNQKTKKCVFCAYTSYDSSIYIFPPCRSLLVRHYLWETPPGKILKIWSNSFSRVPRKIIKCCISLHSINNSNSLVLHVRDCSVYRCVICSNLSRKITTNNQSHPINRIKWDMNNFVRALHHKTKHYQPKPKQVQELKKDQNYFHTYYSYYKRD